ncbi:hypothetical protein [Noviluteimonas gilva]|uniref:Uncharacterized protein n=1 Tax=Noviluteimonas gilva TaxID=2682097 RepID=A0A7C9HLA1_9GAMM|nr:hypothetical protein [Lysobacter gilvus]MUV13572.1 hypothetical protein [Lysobacter gilvus]
MGDYLSFGLGAVTAAVGVIVWLVRLEGRLNVQVAKQEATDKRVDGLEERIVAQLDRIENRLDTLARQ